MKYFASVSYDGSKFYGFQRFIIRSCDCKISEYHKSSQCTVYHSADADKVSPKFGVRSRSETFP